ncbi:MAG: hypothetical protein L0332_12100 [Chloroflexi bacterium]|nr:hypothetical protein [Chloroflexota bacterium]
MPALAVVGIAFLPLALGIVWWRRRDAVPPFEPDPADWHDIEVIPATPEENYENRKKYE